MPKLFKGLWAILSHAVTLFSLLVSAGPAATWAVALISAMSLAIWAALEGLPSSIIVLIALATIAILLIVIRLLFWVWRGIRSYVTKKNNRHVESPELNKTAWQQEWHELRFRRNDFWLLINRAYEHWSGKLEESLRRIIAGSGFPNALPLVDNTTFSSWVWEFHGAIDDISAAANDYASVQNEFVSHIYEPGKAERKSLAFGGANEFDRFDDLRRELSKFWDDWGRQEPLDRVISEQMTSGINQSSAAELKLLTFLEIARARWNPTGASGKNGLFKLAKESCQ